jgi:hypothetical protein
VAGRFIWVFYLVASECISQTTKSAPNVTETSEALSNGMHPTYFG